MPSPSPVLYQLIEFTKHQMPTEIAEASLLSLRHITLKILRTFKAKCEVHVEGILCIVESFELGMIGRGPVGLQQRFKKGRWKNSNSLKHFTFSSG